MDIYKLKWTILELEIFNFLSLVAGEKFSQRELAKILDVSPTAIKNSVKNLIKKELIIIEKTKTINFITFNRDNPNAIELKRAENIKQIYISGLSNFLKEKLAGATIILFGSYSKGEDYYTSDIDFAVIGRKSKELNIEKYEKKLKKKININFYENWDKVHVNLKNNILNGITYSGQVYLKK